MDKNKEPVAWAEEPEKQQVNNENNDEVTEEESVADQNNAEEDKRVADEQKADEVKREAEKKSLNKRKKQAQAAESPPQTTIKGKSITKRMSTKGKSTTVKSEIGMMPIKL